MGQSGGSFTPTSITSVFNNAVLENKLFKTINLEGDAPWGANLETDLQVSGYIDLSWFDKKEASYFAYVRNNSIGEFALRSLNGIGNSLTVLDAGTTSAKINFSISPLVSIGNIISVGDYVYFGYPSPNFAGKVKSINVDLPRGINQIVIDNAMSSPISIPIPNNVNFFLYIKNSVAESHGVLGHYCTFTLQNTFRNKIELFSVEANVMKSFP